MAFWAEVRKQLSDHESHCEFSFTWTRGDVYRSACITVGVEVVAEAGIVVWAESSGAFLCVE
jgi:hypothetical protein